MTRAGGSGGSGAPSVDTGHRSKVTTNVNASQATPAGASGTSASAVKAKKKRRKSNKANPSWATFNAFRERSETIVAATPNGLVPRLTERQQMAILKRQEMAAGVDSLPPGKEEEVSRSGSEEEEEEHAEGAEFAPLPTAATKEVVTEVNLSKRKNASPVERTIVVEPAEETMSPLTAAALAPSSNEISILNGQHNLAIPSDVAMEDAEVDVGITDETMEDAASITAMDDAKVSAGTTTMDGAAEVPAEENPSKTDTDIITQITETSDLLVIVDVHSQYVSTATVNTEADEPMEQSPMKQSSLKLVEPTVVVPMPTVAEETPVTVSPPKSPSKPQKVTVRTPWSARNQLLRDHASFDYSFRSALNLMLARDAGETVRLWREMPGKARRVALHRMRATCIEYWPTARDCSLLAPGLAHVKRMLERAVDSKRCTDILDRLQRICDRSMGALREVTRELGAVVDADSTAAAFLADSEQLLSDHIDQLAVLAHFHREQHLRLLLSFQRTVERMLQTAVIIPRKRVGDDKARLRACALEKLSYALMNLVQSYTKRRHGLTMMLDRECAILVDTIVTAWRHRLTGDAFINKCGWHPVPANIVDATRDLEQLSGDRVFLVRWQSDNHIMAAEHTSNTGSPFVHWITRRCISKNASTVDNVDRLNDSDDRSEEPSSKMDLIAVRLPFDRTKLERLVHGHASMMLEDVHLHGVLT